MKQAKNPSPSMRIPCSLVDFSAFIHFRWKHRRMFLSVRAMISVSIMSRNTLRVHIYTPQQRGRGRDVRHQHRRAEGIAIQHRDIKTFVVREFTKKVPSCNSSQEVMRRNKLHAVSAEAEKDKKNINLVQKLKCCLRRDPGSQFGGVVCLADVR